MARALTLSNLDDVRAEAQQRAQGGQDAPGINIVLRGMFPDVDQATREQITRDAILGGNAAAVLARANRGAFGNPAALLGCVDPSMTVRVSMSVVMTDPATGAVRRHFVDAIDLGRAGRFGAILDTAIGAVLANAQAFGYATQTVTSAMRSGATRYQIHTADCI